jgi:hypothetical protein
VQAQLDHPPPSHTNMNMFPRPGVCLSAVSTGRNHTGTPTFRIACKHTFKDLPTRVIALCYDGNQQPFRKNQSYSMTVSTCRTNPDGSLFLTLTRVENAVTTSEPAAIIVTAAAAHRSSRPAHRRTAVNITKKSKQLSSFALLQTDSTDDDDDDVTVEESEESIGLVSPWTPRARDGMNCIPTGLEWLFTDGRRWGDVCTL